MKPTDFNHKRKVCAYLLKVEAMSDFEFKAHVARLQLARPNPGYDLGSLLFAARSMDKLVKLLERSAQVATSEGAREALAELILQIQAARHDASLDWAIDQEHQRVT